MYIMGPWYPRSQRNRAFNLYIFVQLDIINNPLLIYLPCSQPQSSIQYPSFIASSTSTTYSSIVQTDSSSAIVLQTLDHTGTMTSHTLARLPKFEALEQSYSTLISST